MDADLQGARDAAAQVAPPAAQTEFGVTQTPDGRIRIVSRDGQVTVIDKGVVSQDRLDEMVRSALEPPRGPEMPIDRGPPENAIILTAIIMFFIALTLIGFPMARAAARRMDRKAAGPRVPDDLLPRLDRIEQAVEGVAIEVERVSEAQRFSARLLHERLPEVLPQLDAMAADAAQRRRLEG